VDPVTLDDVDRGLLHALQIDGRAPLRGVAAALEVSENTAARRYGRLREAGAIRVVGALNGGRLGYETWLVRLRATPDAALPLALALARRDDTSWIYLVSGGTEVVVAVQAPSAGSRDALLLRELPRTEQVLGISAQVLLAGFGLPSDWGGLAHLDPARAAALSPPPVEDDDSPLTLESADEPLLAELLRDGRTSSAELAGRTGWSVSTVRRRIAHLRATGLLSFQLDVVPEVLGLRAQARLWLSVAPSDLVETATRIAAHPDVTFVSATTGATNLVATAACRDNRALYRLLTEHLGGVRDVETAPVVRTIKRTGALLPR
jgi:DNA-binding Lrp family transcriptional regulator